MNRQKSANRRRSESGQSLVLIALLMVAMLGFAGLAVDVGFVWWRSSELSKAVDAAVLSGATELGIANDLPSADTRARQFLTTNEVPNASLLTLDSSSGNNILGAVTYSITVTWDVELYFLKLVGQNSIEIDQSATAAFFPLVDLYASRRVEDGILSTSTQSIFGPDICTAYGDPFTPQNPWVERPYAYRYRIGIPDDYEAKAGTNILRVEIFDADSMNAATTDTFQIVHTDVFSNANPAIGQIEPPRTCSQSTDRKDPCLQRTCEWEDQNCSGVTDYPLDNSNPFWFVRVDENRGAGSGNGNGTCGEPGSYTLRYNTELQFRLRYFRRAADGTLADVPLATYTGQTGDSARDLDTWSHETDIAWVSPGGFNSVGAQGGVPTDCGSPLGGYSMPGDDANGDGFDDGGTRCAGQPHKPINSDGSSPSGFEIDLSRDTPNILVDSLTGQRFIYLDVIAMSGASENDFEIWAGPPYYDLPANGNLRNVQRLNELNAGNNTYTSYGATVYAIGVLPMNSTFNNRVDIPLLYVGPQFAGSEIEVSLFDPDSGTNPPITFYFDTVSQDDYKLEFNTQGCWGTSGCNDRWVGPPGSPDTAFIIKIPDLTPECTDPTDPSQGAVCTPFYGGRLMINYQAGGADTYRWVVNLATQPYLID
ncbi:MAG: hypothetical protein KDE09_01860 [Anaerolineales bacterium]|nr:hypothetical protein [Anaerolineales bacterium]MCB8962153.1 hypothetical protein [Ardenticatenales bacterium]